MNTSSLQSINTNACLLALLIAERSTPESFDIALSVR